jgi:hypothetical protein
MGHHAEDLVANGQRRPEFLESVPVLARLEVVARVVAHRVTFASGREAISPRRAAGSIGFTRW